MKLIIENWRRFLNEQDSPSKDEFFHTVKKGDTLGKIAKQYKIPFNALMKLNPEFEKVPRNKDLIYVGEKVRLKAQDEKEEYIDDESELQDLWSTISDYVDDLILANGNTIKNFLKRILIQLNIIKLNDENKNATKKMKDVAIESLWQEYRDMLINFGPSSKPENILKKRDNLSGALDPIKSSTFQDTLRSIDVTQMRVYENILLYYFIAKVGTITGINLSAKEINQVMSVEYRKIDKILRDNFGPALGTGEYGQIFSNSLESLEGDLRSEVERYFSKNKKYFATRKPV